MPNVAHITSDRQLGTVVTDYGGGTHRITGPTFAVPSAGTWTDPYDISGTGEFDTVIGFFPTDWTITIGGHFEISPNDLGVAYYGYLYLAFLGEFNFLGPFGVNVTSNDGNPVEVALDYPDFNAPGDLVDFTFSTSFSGVVEAFTPNLPGSPWVVPDGYTVLYVPDITIVGTPVPATGFGDVMDAATVVEPRIVTSNKIEPITTSAQSVVAQHICD